MNLLIDFDRVIHRQKDGYKNGDIYDTPTDFCKEALHLLNKKYNLMIFTARPEKDFSKIRQYMIDNNLPPLKVTNKKEGGIIIDDKCIRFTSWRDILNYLIEY